jgi:hypothetical protein
MDVHCQTPNASIVAEVDLSVPLAYARESIDLIAHNLVAMARHALH